MNLVSIVTSSSIATGSRQAGLVVFLLVGRSRIYSVLDTSVKIANVLDFGVFSRVLNYGF
jgi:hypothetical protein